MMARFFAMLGVALVAAACAARTPTPAAVDTHNDACRQCRMAVSNVRFAGQLVSPGEEPMFFDDIGCLLTYLERHATLPKGAITFVADHRTGEWVRTTTAVFTRAMSVETPMNSHLIAHASSESRDADPAARAGTAVRLEELLPRGEREGDR